MLTFSIPTPPPVNNLYANVAGKGRVKSDTYRTWRQAAGWDMLTVGIPVAPLAGPVAINLIVGDRRGDLDNRLKGPIDLLVYMGIIKDDKQVEEISASYGGNDPRRSVITVRSLSEASTKRGLAA